MTLPPAGEHGGDGLAVARALGLDPRSILDLSRSLNPLAPDPVPVVSRHLAAVRDYPDPAPAWTALASVMAVDAERLLLTNGGAEAIALVAAELGGRVVEPDFGLHPRDGGPLWRSNPHSPSGLLAAPNEKADVWDEAFFPLATGCWTRGEGVVVGSLTKLLACPGLRLGYVLADPELVATVPCTPARRGPSAALGRSGAPGAPRRSRPARLARGHRRTPRRARWPCSVPTVWRRGPLMPIGCWSSTVACAAAVAARRHRARLRQFRPAVVDEDRRTVRSRARPARRRPSAPQTSGPLLRPHHVPSVLWPSHAQCRPEPHGGHGMSWRRPVPIVGDPSSAWARREIAARMGLRR